MTLLFGSVTLAIGFAGEIYDYRDALLRLVPNAIYLRYHETDIYWHDLFDYMEYLNSIITGRSPIVTYDESTDRFIVDYRYMTDPPTTEVPAGTGFSINGQPVDTIPVDADPPFKLTDSHAADPTNTEVTYETTASVHADTTVPGPYVNDTPYAQLSQIGQYLANDVRAENISYTVTYGDHALSGGSGHEYGYGLKWEGGELYVSGKAADEWIPYREHPALREYLRDVTANGYAPNVLAEFDPTVTIILQPNSRIIDSYGSLLSQGQWNLYGISAICWGIIALIVLILALFIGVIINHRSKAAADAAIGHFIGRIWIEVRLVILLFTVMFYAWIIDMGDEMVGYTFLFATVWFWLYCIITDLHENGLRTFTCNVFSTITRFFRRRANRLPLHKALSRRIWVWGIPTLLCAIAAFLCAGVASGFWGFTAFLLVIAAFYFAGGALIFFLLYFRSRQEDYADIAALTERICAIRDGRAVPPLAIPATHRMAPYADALESIYSGIEMAVAERTKSERTKIEMVTNISHDLKTPLTSIVGYADLLAAVEGLPPEAADYVAVISKKSIRLNGLIKDLFALSKAATGDLSLNPEPLNLTRLLNQLLAEQADAIAAAPITLVTNLPEHDCPCFNDGTKLYRVFANLLENALRYSLDGSRIFLTLCPAPDDGRRSTWRVTLKNTSREYIDFTAEEILGRFVRGDRNRTSEGSGLGLPIAKSFTELCGGKFDLTIDGDSFTVTVDIPQSEPPQ